jgi:hypothetical protein
MLLSSQRLVAVALTILAAGYLGIDLRAARQPTNPPQTSRVESGLTVTCEVFCSTTKIRTTNARIRWSLTKAALDASRVANLSTAKQSLEATIYKNGFEKGQMVSLPIAAVTPTRSIAPEIAQPAQARLRAFQIRLIEIESPRTDAAATAESQMSVVVENLEPGVNYTWRVAIETPAGRMVSVSTTCQAPVCPFDAAAPAPPQVSR